MNTIRKKRKAKKKCGLKMEADHLEEKEKKKKHEKVLK